VFFESFKEHGRTWAKVRDGTTHCCELQTTHFQLNSIPFPSALAESPNPGAPPRVNNLSDGAGKTPVRGSTGCDVPTKARTPMRHVPRVGGFIARQGWVPGAACIEGSFGQVQLAGDTGVGGYPLNPPTLLPHRRRWQLGFLTARHRCARHCST